MQIALTYDEFVEVHQRELSFPVDMETAARHLCLRGCDCCLKSLEVLVEFGTVQPASPDTWSREDVDSAAEYLDDHRFHTPYAAMCETLGCRYVDYLRALRRASERESEKYGRCIPADDQYFVMHRQPPRGVIDENGRLVDIKDATITFTLCDDIRGRIEQGEEI